MTQALKKLEVTKPELNKNVSAGKTQKLNLGTTPVASILNFDQSKVFSRFLEASCDCC